MEACDGVLLRAVVQKRLCWAPRDASTEPGNSMTSLASQYCVAVSSNAVSHVVAYLEASTETLRELDVQSKASLLLPFLRDDECWRRVFDLYLSLFTNKEWQWVCTLASVSERVGIALVASCVGVDDLLVKIADCSVFDIVRIAAFNAISELTIFHIQRPDKVRNENSILGAGVALRGLEDSNVEVRMSLAKILCAKFKGNASDIIALKSSLLDWALCETSAEVVETLCESMMRDLPGELVINADHFDALRRSDETFLGKIRCVDVRALSYILHAVGDSFALGTGHPHTLDDLQETLRSTHTAFVAGAASRGGLLPFAWTKEKRDIFRRAITEWR